MDTIDGTDIQAVSAFRSGFAATRRELKPTDSSKQTHLDRLPHEILLNIFSHLLDHEKYFNETSIRNSRNARFRMSVSYMSDQTVDLRNAALVCRHLKPAAQEVLLRTICVDDQRCGPNKATSLLPIVGRHSDTPTGDLISFPRSKMFKLIRVLMDTPHLRERVKQLHITLLAFRYSDGWNPAIKKLQEDVSASLAHFQKPAGSTSNVQSRPAFAAWLTHYGSPGVKEVVLSNEKLSFWMAVLVALLPKLQSLRLWDIQSSVHKFQNVDAMNRFTHPLPSLIRSMLSHPGTSFSLLHTISLPIFGPYGISILTVLPPRQDRRHPAPTRPHTRLDSPLQ